MKKETIMVRFWSGEALGQSTTGMRGGRLFSFSSSTVCVLFPEPQASGIRLVP